MASRIGSGSTNLVSASPFLGGLNTELSGVVDSTDFTKDELNMLIRPDGTRSRRFGIDYEELYKFSRETADVSLKDLAFNCVEWSDINKYNESEQETSSDVYLVCQIGGKIIFFRNKGKPFSGEQSSFVVDLHEYALDSDKDDYKKERCTFTAAYGCLFISSKAIKPFYLRTAQDEQAIFPEDIPASCTVSCAVINWKKGRVGGSADRGYWKMMINDETIRTYTIGEYYNIPPSAFDNSLYFLPCSTQIAEVWNSLPEETRKGITAIPKYSNATPTRWGLSEQEIYEGGKYIPDEVTFVAPTGSGKEYEGLKVSLYYHGYGKNRSGGEWVSKTYEGTLAGSFNYSRKEGLQLVIRDTEGVHDWMEVDTKPAKLSYAHLYNLLNQGWTEDTIVDFYNAQNPKVFPANNLAVQYLKDSTTTKFKPEALLNCVFGNTPAAKGHFLLDFFNQDRNTEAELSTVMSSIADKLDTTVDNIIDKTTPDWDDPAKQVPAVTPRKNFVTDTCAYAGRIFYLCGDVLLYSQMIVEDILKADSCYTDADPTSEILSDIVETDGGMISLPEIGEGVKLAQVGANLFVFGTRGVFVISGTANNIFTATAYSAGSVSAIPSQAPYSFVETEYGILYWGLTGIQMISVGAQGLNVQDLSTERILSFYGRLTNEQHRYCKGVYSSSNKKVYWFYPSDPENAPRKLDKILIFDLVHAAFLPQELSAGKVIEGEFTEHDTPEIVSGTSIKVPFKNVKEYPITAEEFIPGNYSLHGTARIHEGILDTSGEWVNVRPQGMLYSPEISTDTAKELVIKTTIKPFKLNRSSTLLALYKKGETYTDYVDHGIARARIGISTDNLLSLSYRASENDEWIHKDMSRFVLQEGESYDIELYFHQTDTALRTIILRVKKSSAEGWGEAFTVTDQAEGIQLYAWRDHYDPESFLYTTTPEVDNSVTLYEKGLMNTVKYSTETIENVVDKGEEFFTATGGRFRRYSSRDFIGRVDKFFDSPCTLCLAGETAGYFFGNWWFNGEMDLSKTSMKINGGEAFNPVDPVPYYSEVVDDNCVKILADDPIESEEFSYESSILLCLDVANAKVTFGDFRSNLLRDWVAGDYQGVGYTFDSYLISHPMTCTSINQYGQRVSTTVTQKSLPNVITGFRRTETGKTTEGEYLYPSACQGSVLWNWATSGQFGKWDAPQEFYRPNKRTIFTDGYIFNRTNIRGLGRAYQLKLESVEDKQFILESISFNVQNDGRI